MGARPGLAHLVARCSRDWFNDSPLSDDHAVYFLPRRGQKVMPSPTRRTAAKSKKSADCLSQAIAGTKSAMARPRKQISKDRRLIPARKVPSASNIKSTRLFAGAGTIL